jgi:hypothetical protein
MPIVVVKDVTKRCRSGKLRTWESNLKEKNKLNCKQLGEAVASIVQAKIDKKKLSDDTLLWEFYQSLAYVDSQEVEGILNMSDSTVYELKGKEIFAVGTWKGDEYTKEDLDEMIKSFQSLDFKPALKIHHEKNKENKSVGLLNPALGYVSNLYRKGKKLLVDFSNMPKKVFDAVKNGAYSRVSAEVAWNLKRNGKIYKKALTAVSLLGADIPAVSDLETLNGLYTYSEEDDIHSYDFSPEELKEHRILEWEDTKTSYIYWACFFSGGINSPDLKKEKVEEGITKLTEVVVDVIDEKQRFFLAGYVFDKKKFSLAKAKKWIGLRKDGLYSEETKEDEFQVKMKTEGDVKFPKEAYAYVPDPNKPNTWKLRLWESPTAKITAKQVGAAIAAFSPGGFRGRKVQIPSKDVAGAKNKVRVAWKKANPDKKATEMPKHIQAAEDLDIRISSDFVYEGFFWDEEYFTDMGETIPIEGYWNGEKYSLERNTIPKEYDELAIKAIPESAGDNNTKKEEVDDMADKELEKRLEELEKKLSESNSKIEELQTASEEATQAFSDKETELQGQLREAEEKNVKLSEEQTKLQEENKEFADEKTKLETKAKEKEIDSFIADQKRAGKVLPKFEAQLKALLSVEMEEGKVCEFSVGKEVKKLSYSDTVRELIKALPDLVVLKELSHDVNDVTDESLDVVLDKKIRVFCAEKKLDPKKDYLKAYKSVLESDPEFAEQYVRNRN